MKKLFLTLLAIAVLNVPDYAVASSVIEPSASSTATVTGPAHSPAMQLRIAQMKFFVGLTPEQYGNLKGKKLNLLEKMAFKVSQKRMKKMLQHYDYGDEPTTLSKISWLLKGLILGPIALLLGYLFLRDEERELIKWIWFGFAGFTAIVVALLLTM